MLTLACVAGTAQSLVYSTYLGGSSSDIARAVAVDRLGYVYITGETLSGDLPVTPGAFQTKLADPPTNTTSLPGDPRTDAFVAKFSPDGARVVWCTYLGGAGRDVGNAIAVDDAGNVYVAGTTAARDFPTTAGAWQERASGPGQTHGFVTKLNPEGTALVYSTMLAGSVFDEIRALAVDRQGNAFVVGHTLSPDFPITPGAWQTNPSQAVNGFVTKVHFSGSALIYSTFLTGVRGANVSAIALDAEGSAIVAGDTGSPDFPITPGAYQDTFAAVSQAYVSKVNLNGSALIWSTFLGRDKQAASAVTVDRAGSVFAAGYTRDSAFVTRLQADGGFMYDTLLGGRQGAAPNAIAADDNGNVYVAGQTFSADFPVTANAIGSSYAAAPCFSMGGTPVLNVTVRFNCGDAFLTVLDDSGAIEQFSTLLGGNAADTIFGVALDKTGGIYVAGATGSANFPTTSGVFRTSRVEGTCRSFASPSASDVRDCEETFVAKLSLTSNPAPLRISNGASRVPGRIAPGELIHVSGPGLDLGTKQVFFDGVASPVVENFGDLLVQVPPSVSGKQKVTVSVQGRSVMEDVVAFMPGIFVPDRSATGVGAIVNQDGMQNGPRSPAPPLSVAQVFVTGDAMPSVYVGGQSAQVVFAGPAPRQSAGVQQINFRVPNVPDGPQPIFVGAGLIETSQPGVIIWIGK